MFVYFISKDIKVLTFVQATIQTESLYLHILVNAISYYQNNKYTSLFLFAIRVTDGS